MKNYLKSSMLIILGVILGITLKINVFADNQLDITKSNIPIFIDDEKAEVDAYNINGSTYMKISDINEKTSLDILFNEEENIINIYNPTNIQIREFSGRKYVDMSHYSFKYSTFGTELPYDSQKIPYAYEVRTASDQHPGSLTISTPINSSNGGEVIADMPIEKMRFNGGIYVELETFKEKLYPILLEMTVANEEYIKNNSNEDLIQ